MWLAFSCSAEVLIASCVKMQLAHVSLVCLVFAAGFVSTEGKEILHVYMIMVLNICLEHYCLIARLLTVKSVCNNQLE